MVQHRARITASAAARRLRTRDRHPRELPARLITRLGGLREIAAGVGILTTPRPATWLSSRVAGDMMDLGLLGVAFTAPSARRSRLLAAMAAVAGATVLDARCAQRLTGPPSTSGRAVRARRSITINRTAEELYRFWRDLSNLPRFMAKVESVQPDRRAALTLDREGTGGNAVRVGGRDHRGPAQPAHRLAVGRRAPSSTRPARALPAGAGRPGHGGRRGARVHPTGQEARRAAGQAVRRGPRAAAAAGSPALQAAHGDRGDHRGQRRPCGASRVASTPGRSRARTPRAVSVVRGGSR